MYVAKKKKMGGKNCVPEVGNELMQCWEWIYK